MKILFLFFVFLLIINSCRGTTCDQAESLPDLERRARNYQAKGDFSDDPYVDDEYLVPGWFSVRDYRMPDSNIKPETSFCGTVQPVYVKGTHPDITTLTADSPVSIEACESYPFDDCHNEHNIEVRICGDDLQYYLVRTSTQSAYCMDPPEVLNVTEFDEAPTDVQIGQLTVNPKLKFEETNGYEVPYNEYECKESTSEERSGILYSTYWFVNSVLLKAFERREEIISLTDDDLQENGLGLGVTIQCGVRVSTSVTGLQTTMATSNSFFAGIEVTPLVINMDKSDTSIITLTPTVPLGCYAEIGDQPTGKCSHSINMYYPDLTEQQCEIDTTIVGSLPNVNNEQSKCGVEIQGFYPYQAGDGSSLTMDAVTMQIISPYFSDSDPTFYKLGLKTKNGGTHAIWKDAVLPQVQLNIITNTQYQNKLCFAHVDPHMYTSDGRAYEHNSKPGYYILYRNDVDHIEVQIRTTLCNNNNAYCVCAVSVRAGGDVFLINLCGQLRFVDMISCKDGGLLVIQKYSEFNYQVQTNIGTLIIITIFTGSYANLMNVDIHMAPMDFNNIKGLCGTFDGNTNNDFHDRNGDAVDRTAFINAWELIDSDTNMLDPTCSLDVLTWQEEGRLLYCTCDCYDDQCGTLEDTATCSPSQYVNCTVNLNKNIELCEDYIDRCSVNVAGKRSSFFTDPEEEMKRQAALSNRPHRYKRETDPSTNITNEMARTICQDKITTDVITQNGNLLGGFNLTQAINDCTFDVYSGQDPGWADTHKQAAQSAIGAGYKRDANYTLSHLEDLREFKQQTCPYDCNGNGVCLENGTCSCNSVYFGPVCLNDKSQGPELEDVEGGGFCDQRYGSECKCFSVQADALDDRFTCKMVRKKVMMNGDVETVGTSTTTGRFRNFYNGECCFANGRRKRSSDSDENVLHYRFDVSLSNDGVNFGLQSLVYIYDSSCLQTETSETGNVSFSIKSNTCVVNGDCYEMDEVDISNECNKCEPNNTQLAWTNVCETKESPSDSNTLTLLIVAIVGGIIFLVIVVSVVIFLCMKFNKAKRTVQASQDFTLIRMQSKASFNLMNYPDLIQKGGD